MPKSLQEYAAWLAEREDLLWPQPPKPQAPKATPYLKPLPGIRLVLWNVYGTLLHIADGCLLHLHPQELRMQVALEKTIREFNMWNSMTRKPGAPWEYMLQLYRRALEELQMSATKKAGDVPEVDSSKLWKRLVAKLQQKEYRYDESFYGDDGAFCTKVAYFFHSSLQGLDAMPHVVTALCALYDAGLRQGLLADAQPFTLVQILRCTRPHGTLPPLGDLFAADTTTLSYLEGLRKPSPTLFDTAVRRVRRLEIAPHEILYVTSQLRDDLEIAKRNGMRTALFGGDVLSLSASPADMKNPDLRPDRLVVDLRQIRDVLGVA